MPALRVSKPSGMGGARQLLGAWRGGGLPGGGHGTAYLEPPSLPEHAHRPHTHHHGQLKLQGRAMGVLGNHGKGEEPHLLHHLETGRGSGGPQRNLMEALKERAARINVKSGSWKTQDLFCLNLKRRLGRPWQPCRPSPFLESMPD